MFLEEKGTNVFKEKLNVQIVLNIVKKIVLIQSNLKVKEKIIFKLEENPRNNTLVL